MGKLAARRAAKEYVAGLITNQDTPDWAINAGLSEDELLEFDAEIERVADRLFPARRRIGREGTS